jgi:hypothetical protein
MAAAKKTKLKTKPTKVSVRDFIAAVPNETRRKDAETLLKVFEKVTSWKPQMWGPTIVGFGKYSYTYDSGHSGDMCVVGFSPRGSSLSIYSGIYPEQPEAATILKTMGKHTHGKGCIYINKLADVDMKAFEKLIKTGVANMKKVTKEKGWPLEAT